MRMAQSTAVKAFDDQQVEAAGVWYYYAGDPEYVPHNEAMDEMYGLHIDDSSIHGCGRGRGFANLCHTTHGLPASVRGLGHGCGRGHAGGASINQAQSIGPSGRVQLQMLLEERRHSDHLKKQMTHRY